MEAAAAAGVPYLVFASTSEVYPTSGLNREDGPLAPQSPYAVAKLVQEQLVRGWAADAGRRAAVLRLTTVYGPGEPVRRAVPRFIAAALRGLPLPLDGDGAQVFAPVFVGDVAAAFQAAFCSSDITSSRASCGPCRTVVKATPPELALSCFRLAFRVAPMTEIGNPARFSRAGGSSP